MKGFVQSIATVALGIVVFVPLALGESLEEALERADRLEEEGRFAEVVVALEPFGAKADGELAFRLAQAHLFSAIGGLRIEEAEKADVSAARRWIDRALELDNAAAYQLLYMIYKEGFGVPADMAAAVEYLRLGVADGDPGAKTNLAVLAYLGVPPIEKDVHLAAKYFMELARADPPNVVAIYYLGVIEFRGQAGMPKDEKAGLEMIEIAANHGIKEAERDMGKALEYGWAGRDRDLQGALDWYGKAASHGDPFALWRVGLAHAEGEFGESDPKRAIDFFHQAAEAGERNGMTSLGVMFATSSGVPQDFDKTRLWYEKAVEHGDIHAMKNLAVMYTEGQGVPVDLVRAYVLATRTQQADVEQAAALMSLIERRISPSELEEARRQIAAEPAP